MAKITQTAGRNALGEFAPEFAHFNDDVLFGENWNNQDIDVKTRSIITVVALMASFYTGWPKGWAVFNLAKEVWDVNEGDLPYEDQAMRAHAKEMVFPIGAPNDGFAQYFSGKSFLAINIPTEVKHWHGAAPDSWFSHLAVEVPGEETSNEWCEPVLDEDYAKLK